MISPFEAHHGVLRGFALLALRAGTIAPLAAETDTLFRWHEVSILVGFW